MGKYFTFEQNNSGGDFIVDSDLSHYVIVEANSPEEANKAAYDIGLYFRGIDNGIDCPCCGDRWFEKWSDDKGTDEPEVWGSTDLQEKANTAILVNGNEPVIHVYHMSGDVDVYRKHRGAK